MENTAANSLYDLLVTRDLEPEILDKQGKPVMDPTQGEMFSFDYKTENHNYGTVVILLGADHDLQVFFGDNVGRSMEGDDKSDWYDFLHQLKNFATRNMLSFELNNINRLKYTMQGLAAIKEGLFEGYYGRKNVSYRDEPKQVRLMIKHNRNIDEGEARHRAVESLFIETADGERFKVPSRNLTHGRLLARHVAEGGNPYDAFGQHINEIVAEMSTLARFIRAARGREFAGDVTELVETAIRHYSELKDKAKRMLGQRGYKEERENFDPTQVTDTEVTTEAVRDMFIEKNIDHRIEEALPILTRLANTNKEPKMREADEFESWTNQVMEGTWSLPETPEQQAALKELMSKPLMVGPDAENATSQLYDLIGDDQLFDRLADLADQDPNANCWDDEGVINRLGELGIDINSTVGPESGEQSVTEGEGNLATALGKLSGSWSGWHKEEDMSTPEVDHYEYDDGEGGYYGRGTIEHNLKTGEVKVKYHDSENEMDVDGTFKNMGDAMRALRGEHGVNHGGQAPNFDRLGQRTPSGPDDLRKTDRTGRKGTVGGGFANARKASIQHSLGKHGPKGVLPEQDVTEGMEDSPVASAITRRILSQRLDLLKKYGPVAVTQAIDDVADFVGDVEEIGSSDVSGWIRQVEQSLGGVDEGVVDTVKKVGSRVFDKLGGGTDQELLDKLRKDAGLPPRMAVPNKKDVEEDLDTDGVMMTKASNMSS